MALTPDQVDDFVNLTLPLFKRHAWTDISLEHPDYISAQLLKKRGVEERGGPDVRFKVQVRNTGNARNTGMLAQDVTKIEDVTVGAVVPWTMQTVNWSYSIYEDLFQTDRETIVRELVLREHDAMNSMAELNEENFWSEPTDPEDTRPMGVPFWIRKDPSTDPEGGFNGGNPSGFAAGCAGISSTTYPRWRNWTFGYEKVTSDDMVRKVKRALRHTHFRAPHPHPELGWGKAEHEIFTTEAVQEPLERLAETRNDNHGNDVARYMNSVVIGGVPVRWVPYLDANDSTDPVYGINWRVFRPYVKAGCNMRRNPVKQSAKQHDGREIHIDHWGNYICVNRRLTFVGSKAS